VLAGAASSVIATAHTRALQLQERQHLATVLEKSLLWHRVLGRARELLQAVLTRRPNQSRPPALAVSNLLHTASVPVKHICCVDTLRGPVEELEHDVLVCQHLGIHRCQQQKSLKRCTCEPVHTRPAPDRPVKGPSCARSSKSRAYECLQWCVHTCLPLIFPLASTVSATAPPVVFCLSCTRCWHLVQPTPFAVPLQHDSSAGKRARTQATHRCSICSQNKALSPVRKTKVWCHTTLVIKRRFRSRPPTPGR